MTAAELLLATTLAGTTASNVIPGPCASHSGPSAGFLSRPVGQVAKNLSALPPAKKALKAATSPPWTMAACIAAGKRAKTSTPVSWRCAKKPMASYTRLNSGVVGVAKYCLQIRAPYGVAPDGPTATSIAQAAPPSISQEAGPKRPVGL